MRVTPKSDKELAEENLLQPGRYGFMVEKAEDTSSKTSGAEMIKLKLRVYKNDGGFIYVTDYLLDAMGFKVKNAAKACGVLAEYNNGSLEASDFEGKSGYLKIKIEVDKSGEYASKNSVKNYEVPDENAKGPVPSSPQPYQEACPFGDDIPF